LISTSAQQLVNSAALDTWFHWLHLTNVSLRVRTVDQTNKAGRGFRDPAVWLSPQAQTLLPLEVSPLA
jgi:hypothetical protein